MSWLHQLTQRTALFWAIILLVSTPTPAQAQWWWPPSWFRQRSNWGPASGNYTGAAQRGGSCGKVPVPLTALAPFYQAEDGQQYVLGATASDYPILWFYLPYEIGTAATNLTPKNSTQPIAELRLEEQDPKTQRSFQRTVLELPATKPGVIGIPLPRREPALIVGKTYHWLLVVRCDPSDASTNQFAELSLHRVQPPVPLSSIATAPPRQQLSFYVQNGLWSETMTLCDRIQRASGDPDLLTEWSKIIESVPLNGIMAQQVVAECRAGKQKILPQ
ncbi:MAG TPA: DUF928 domain-containing protein [Leptolyngbyaceae cyanobacterium M33_DOE_097]|uniref:DUF928 domain-containing protein n=1 Tax=Oscillatoriales cyanobacterium SpSt-418 TaxID=2282169 RepID=A0A7C3PHV3_9CYAN|nr:DUF928 domain-containing protein [Leptolyngbyaceae cyanobacterium M33_DOE_097]